MRDFWRSHRIGIGEFATRFARSSDLYGTKGRRAHRLGEPDHRPRQLGILERERGGSVAAAVTWHVKALAIRLRLGVPEAVIDLRRLAALRRELGAGRFTRLLTQAADSTGLADTITSLLDQVDKTGGGTT